MLVDSHCHLDRLDLSFYNNNLDLVLKKAHEVNVNYFLCAGITLENSATILDIAKKHDNIVTSVGLHPTEEYREIPDIKKICELANDNLVVAIGETGLDYAYCLENKEAQEMQQKLFATHICAAKEIQKPIIIHSRMAQNDLLNILKAEKAREVGGVFHCFTETLEMAEEALNMGFYISFSGIVTFKNAENLREVAKKIPLNKMLVETDAPYLAPTPHRGKANEPFYLPYVVECLAKIRGESFAAIADATTENFFRLFKCKNINY